MEYHIGTSGWSYNHWKGVFYPPKLAPAKWLAFYAEHFSTVEVNMTFYRTPATAVIERWFTQTPDDFVFTLKVPRTITHVKRLHGMDGSLRGFYELLEGLGQKARCLLFQMPPSFQLNRENAGRVSRLTELIDPRYDHAIEFRHHSWWCDETRDLLAGRIAFCSVNGLDMPEDITVTGDVTYLRFHGTDYGGSYGDRALRHYADTIHALAAAGGLRRIYIYFNNDMGGCAVANAMTIERMLEERFGP